jgi:hypothetical protein
MKSWSAVTGGTDGIRAGIPGSKTGLTALIRLCQQKERKVQKANNIIHEVIVLDASTSMHGYTSDVIKVTDSLISHLASQVKIFPEQETRITIYAFSSEKYMGGQSFQCLIWDKDVLRVPSISGLYKPNGNTALADTMVQVIKDLKEIPVQYGDHTVLLYLVTDGEENVSHPESLMRLPRDLASLPDTWTVAGLVPGVRAKQQLVRFGFPAGNVEIWDPSQKDAILEVGEKIRTSSAAYASASASPGFRSTQNLFQMASPSVKTMTAGGVPMTPGSYFFEEVDQDSWNKVENGRIDQFMSLKTGKPYVADGKTYYQMVKRERIQHYKQIAVAVPDHKNKTVALYTGNDARAKLGLPQDGTEVRVSPGHWKGYKVYIQSTSLNRKLVPGTSLLVMR